MGQPYPTRIDHEPSPKTGDVIGKHEPLGLMIPGEFERRPIRREGNPEGEGPANGIDEERTPA